MKQIFFFIATLAILVSSCKKELQPTPTTETAAVQNIIYNPPPPPGTCEGNTWENDHTFYPDWEFDPQQNFPSDLNPFVYNDKVYVPDYEDREMRIFDGNSWEHLPSNVPIHTNYRCFAFTTGSMAYIGNTNTNNKKFYRYSFLTNSWLRRADCPFELRYCTAAFSIGTKGYVAAGWHDGANIRYKDLWEYNPATDTWTRKADLPVVLDFMACFVVNNKAYLVGGRTGPAGSSSLIDDVYEYNPVTNTWTSRAPFPGGNGANRAAFVINGKAYCGGGYDTGGERSRDYYRYNHTANTWTRVADMSLDFMTSTEYGFSLNSYGYAVYRHSVSDNLFTVKYSPLVCTVPLP